MYDCDDFTPFLYKFRDAGLTPNEVEKAMKALEDFSGLTYSELRNVSSGIVMWIMDERRCKEHGSN